MAVIYTCDMCKNVVLSEHHLTTIRIPCAVNMVSTARNLEYWKEDYDICVDCGAELDNYIRQVYAQGKSDQAKAIHKAMYGEEEQDETESENNI